MTLASLRKWAADDFVAATHQSMGQYRTALLRIIDDAIQQTFQVRVQPWMLECFGPEIAADAEERNHRFLEEALELVQACGCTRSEAHQLVDYVFSRPVGEKHQEVGGVMVTLAALCLAQSLNMHAAGETELARIWTKVEQIRAKQAAKPKHSPLPAPAPAPAAQAGEREPDLYDEIECDLPALFGRASAENHEAGQALAAQLQAKMRKARQRPPLSEGVEAVIACLGDDAAMLRDVGEHEEVAMNMDDAARLLEAAYNTTPPDAASEADKSGEAGDANA